MAIVMGLLTFNACLDYDDLRENPNDPNSVPPSLIFTEITPGPVAAFDSDYERMQYHLEIRTDNVSEPSFRSGFGGSFGGYGTIRNITKMNEEAEKANAPAYIILGKFLKARAYIEMTRRMGDIPLSEAEQGQDNPQPKYDSQKSVYIQCLNWLDETNTELGAFIADNPTVTIEGDAYFEGNLVQWQKLINAYTLRILISLSKKADDPQVNVQGRFSRILDNPAQYPLMEGLQDNAQLTYRNEDGFRQGYQPNCAICREAEMYASTYIDLLKNKLDPRLMQVADPTPMALAANPNEAEVRADFDSYGGADISAKGSDNVTQKNEGLFSPPNFDRYWNFIGQPGVWLSYWEQELTIAEAANRGWISQDGKTHYDNGVIASMDFYNVSADDSNDYIANKQPYVAGMAGLTRTLEQKYIAFAENSDQESFFTTRRTGVPTYVYSTFNGIEDDETYPVRWTYPSSEQIYNAENYYNALRSQFGAEVDNIDQVIWLLED
jgi:hypothetical protein